MRGEFIDVGGARIYYYAAGTRGSGEPIVLIHGFPTSSHLWGAVVPVLPAGRRVVVPDLLGFGRSDPPAPSGAAADVTVRGHAMRSLALLDALRIPRVCIVGHGLGAAVALALAAERPQAVTHLCLVNPVTAASWPAGYARLARIGVPLATVLPATWTVRLFRFMFDRSHQPDNARSNDLYVRPFSLRLGRAAMVRHLRALSTPPPMPALAGINAIPAALIAGTDDPLVARDLAALRVLLPQATVDVIPGGHYLPEESPELVAAVIARLLDPDGAR